MLIFDLFETPIEDFNLVGDWSVGHSYDNPQDRKILTNPKAQEQIKHKWQRTVVPFNMYFVNMPKYQRMVELGEVSPKWVRKNMREISDQIKINPQAVNVIFTNNSGDDGLPVTAWILAHRLAHVLDEKEYGVDYHVPEMEDAIYGFFDALHRIFTAYGVNNFPRRLRDFWEQPQFHPMMMALVRQIGTMRSVRSNKLNSPYEFFLELFAQYIITGKVTFNQLPRELVVGRNQLTLNQDANGVLTELSNDLQQYFQKVLRAIVGRIFVM